MMYRTLLVRELFDLSKRLGVITRNPNFQIHNTEVNVIVNRMNEVKTEILNLDKLPTVCRN